MVIKEDNGTIDLFLLKRMNKCTPGTLVRYQTILIFGFFQNQIWNLNNIRQFKLKIKSHESLKALFTFLPGKTNCAFDLDRVNTRML